MHFFPCGRDRKEYFFPSGVEISFIEREMRSLTFRPVVLLPYAPCFGSGWYDRNPISTMRSSTRDRDTMCGYPRSLTAASTLLTNSGFGIAFGIMSTTRRDSRGGAGAPHRELTC